MSNWKQNLVIAGILLVVDAYFLITSLSYPSDSNTFPLMLSILLGVVTLMFGGQALLAARAKGYVRFVELGYYRGVGVQIVLIAVFALIAPFAGYLVAGALLCFATACNGGYPNWKISVCFSIGVSVFVFIVFKIVLLVPLPLGIFFN